MPKWTRAETALFVAALVITLTLGWFGVPEWPAVGVGVAPLAAYEFWQVALTARRVRVRRRTSDSHPPKDAS